MNWKFIKHAFADLALWALIYFGLFVQVEYVEAAALFVLWVVSALAVLCSFVMKEIVRDLDTRKALKKSPAHKRYAMVSTFLESVAIAASGHFVLAAVYLFAGMAFTAGADSELKKLEPQAPA